MISSHTELRNMISESKSNYSVMLSLYNKIYLIQNQTMSSHKNFFLGIKYSIFKEGRA